MAVFAAYRRHAEWRKKPRRPFNYEARIEPGKGKPLVACLVADISEGGARICLARNEALPQIFTLLLTRNGDTRRFCQVLRRDGPVLGVRFIAEL